MFADACRVVQTLHLWLKLWSICLSMAVSVDKPLSDMASLSGNADTLPNTPKLLSVEHTQTCRLTQIHTGWRELQQLRAEKGWQRRSPRGVNTAQPLLLPSQKELLGMHKQTCYETRCRNHMPTYLSAKPSLAICWKSSLCVEKVCLYDIQYPPPPRPSQRKCSWNWCMWSAHGTSCVYRGYKLAVQAGFPDKSC